MSDEQLSIGRSGLYVHAALHVYCDHLFHGMLSEFYPNVLIKSSPIKGSFLNKANLLIRCACSL